MRFRDAPYELYESAFCTGSSVICNPPVTNTDIDIMFFTKDMTKFGSYLMKNDWKMDGSYGFEGNFISLKKKINDNLYNYLLTSDIDYYDSFQEATVLATKLNLLEKDKRITLFNYVMNGEV